ncbi:MAG: T9SS type A sorting domain-containing protein [Bacteroidetes bacterium]|nr:MAG: T9SS type A sorting domain-containing protein [Bacteroidota bacterium]
MKRIANLLIVIFTVILFTNLFSQEYSHPKSMVYDAARDRYLISNVQSGQVLALSNSNELTVFIDGQMAQPRGMLIVEDTLLVVDGSALVWFKLDDGSFIKDTVIEGASKLVDLTIDDEKYIYFTDIIEKKLFIYNLLDKSMLIYNFKQSTWPNGIIYDKNKLYVTTYGDSAQIVVFDLSSWSETKYDYSNYKYFDGIVTDGNGTFYVACWEDMMSYDSVGKILKFSVEDINNLTVFKTGLWGPSDIYFNPIKNEIAVPNYTGDTVSFIPLATNVFDNQNENDLFQVEHNKINNALKIRFKKNLTSNEYLYVYNIYGQLMQKVQISLNQNEYNLNLNGYIQGIYFIKIGNNISKFLISN